MADNKITMEEVVKRATELGLSLTSEQAEAFVQKNELPDEDFAKEHKSETELEKRVGKDAYAIIRETREEAKRNRLEKEKAEKKLKDIDKEKENAKNQKLIDDKKWEDLYNAEKAKNETLSPKAEAYETLRTSRVTSIKTQMGKNWKDSYANIPIEDLESIATAFTKKAPAPTDNNNNTGDNNGGNKNIGNLSSPAQKMIGSYKDSAPNVISNIQTQE